MDGEHAFSASLTLVMVNVAFPYNERDARALETSLGVLQGMAEKGNEYIQARRSLLLDVLSTIGRRPYGDADAGMFAATPNDFTNFGAPQYNPVPAGFGPAPANPDQSSLQLETNFQPFRDVSLTFDINDDPKVWEEISGNIDIDMATGWMESALRSGAYQGLDTDV